MGGLEVGQFLFWASFADFRRLGGSSGRLQGAAPGGDGEFGALHLLFVWSIGWGFITMAGWDIDWLTLSIC